MRTSMTRKERMLRAALCAALAIGFGLIFYAFNTPLGPSIGSDNAIYLTMGTAIARGYAPYTEIFDHKGPLVFILQAIPQALSGGYSTLAVFIQQVLFLFACLRVIDAIARAMDVRFGAPAQLLYLALIGSLVGGGNLTEEYANLFTLLGLYAAVRVFGVERERTPRALLLPAALLGAMAMLCLMTRANNALPLCGAALGLSLWLLLSRRFAQLGACALGFAAGAVVAALPVAFWLAANGALSASIYGAFIHNMMYAETEGASRIQMLLHSGYGLCAMVMAALTCAGALALWLRTRRMAVPLTLIFAAAAGGAAAFVSHKYYDHYLILGAPAAAVGVCALLGAAQGLPKRARGAALCAGLALCCLWLGVKGRETNDWRLSELVDSETFAENARALYAQVPEDERDRFMAYRVEPKWYACTGALPCMRFYFLQEVLAQADPAVMDEIVATFETDPPLWLVIYYNREFGPPYDARVAEIFERDYEFVDARGQYQLLRHREGA